jgi:hypothetical protein
MSPAEQAARLREQIERAKTIPRLDPVMLPQCVAKQALNVANQP